MAQMLYFKNMLYYLTRPNSCTKSLYAFSAAVTAQWPALGYFIGWRDDNQKVLISYLKKKLPIYKSAHNKTNIKDRCSSIH